MPASRLQNLSQATDWQAFDDFERTDLGSPVIGNSPWIVAPAGALGAPSCVVPIISGGALVVPDETDNSLATYIAQNLPGDATEMGAIVSFHGSGNHGYGSVALIISEDPADGESNYHIIRSKCIHMVFTSSYFTLGFFDGTTSGSEFTTLPAVFYPSACALDGTKYAFSYRIDTTTGVMRVALPGGTVKLIQDDRIKTYNGPTVTFEHFKLTPPSGDAPSPRFYSVWAR